MTSSEYSDQAGSPSTTSADTGVSGLLPHHVQKLADHAVDPFVAVTVGVRSVTQVPPGFEVFKGLHPSGLVIPWRCNGSTAVQFQSDRLFTPKGNDKPAKYLWKPGQALVVAVSQPKKSSEYEKILLAEGTFKYLAALSYATPDVLVVGLPGSSGWLREGVPVPSLGEIDFDGKTAVVAFDADIATNPQVHLMAERLDGTARSLGAKDVLYLTLPTGGKTGLDDYLAAMPDHKREDVLRRLIGSAGPLPKGPKQQSPVTAQAIKLAESLFLSVQSRSDLESYAIPKARPHLALRISGRGDTAIGLLKELYYKRHKTWLSQSPSRDVAEQMEQSGSRGQVWDIGHRAHFADGVQYLDVGDKGGRVLRIDSAGWKYTNELPDRYAFARGGRTAPLPEVMQGTGDLSPLWDLLRVRDIDEQSIVLADMICLLRRNISQPIRLYEGEEDTGKTTRARIVLQTVDPIMSPENRGGRVPKDDRTWRGKVRSSLAVMIDNQSGMHPDLADLLCQISTGGENDAGRLYSNDDLVSSTLRCPIVLTTIDPGMLRGDFASRLLRYTSESIPPEDRIPDSELWQMVATSAGPVLTGLLDVLVKVLAVEPTLPRKDIWYRSGDFQIVLRAVDQVRQTEGEELLRASRKDIKCEVVESSPVATALLELARTQPSLVLGRHTANEILKVLPLGHHDTKLPQGWPQTARMLGGRLRRVRPALFSGYGLDVTFGKRGSKYVQVRWVDDSNVPHSESPDSNVPRSESPDSNVPRSEPPSTSDTSETPAPEKTGGSGVNVPQRAPEGHVDNSNVPHPKQPSTSGFNESGARGARCSPSFTSKEEEEEEREEEVGDSTEKVEEKGLGKRTCPTGANVPHSMAGDRCGFCGTVGPTIEDLGGWFLCQPCADENQRLFDQAGDRLFNQVEKQIDDYNQVWQAVTGLYGITGQYALDLLDLCDREGWQVHPDQQVPFYNRPEYGVNIDHPVVLTRQDESWALLSQPYRGIDKQADDPSGLARHLGGPAPYGSGTVALLYEGKDLDRASPQEQISDYRCPCRDCRTRNALRELEYQ